MAFNRLALVLGNCLFPDHNQLTPTNKTLFFMAEDSGLCTHFKYHKHKLVLFLSAMRSHADIVREQHELEYYKLSKDNQHESYEDKLKKTLKKHPEIEEFVTYDIEDHFFENRIRQFCKEADIKLTVVNSPGFITTKEDFAEYNRSTKKPFMQVFYKNQRKGLGILMEPDGSSPINGKWSFDEDNRKKLPKGIQIPEIPTPQSTQHTGDVKKLVDELFPNHPGSTE
ncbi:MAG: cryptochrome/photolyase family protein, partial [Bacteroidota bacterium]